MRLFTIFQYIAPWEVENRTFVNACVRATEWNISYGAPIKSDSEQWMCVAVCVNHIGRSVKSYVERREGGSTFAAAKFDE